MKIAIASDIHDNLANLENFLNYIKKDGIKILILCGDLCGKEVIEILKKNFIKKIYLVLGNADRKEEIVTSIKNLSNIKLFKNFGEIKVNRVKIGFCHQLKIQKRKFKNYDFIFYGHTHKPWLKKIGNCILANPGNLAGLYFKASFAILDTKTKKLELKILEKVKV